MVQLSTIVHMFKYGLTTALEHFVGKYQILSKLALESTLHFSRISEKNTSLVQRLFTYRTVSNKKFKKFATCLEITKIQFQTRNYSGKTLEKRVGFVSETKRRQAFMYFGEISRSFQRKRIRLQMHKIVRRSKTCFELNVGIYMIYCPYKSG